jgi:hypothetical protein
MRDEVEREIVPAISKEISQREMMRDDPLYEGVTKDELAKSSRFMFQPRKAEDLKNDTSTACGECIAVHLELTRFFQYVENRRRCSDY